MCRRGFTILEVLVVLGIIIVLVAIFVPVMRSTRETSKVVVCASQLKQMGVGTAAYATAHRGLVPPAANPTQKGGMWIWDGRDKEKPGYRLFGALLDGDFIGRDGKLFMCPGRDDTYPALFTPSGKPLWGRPGRLIFGDYLQNSVQDGLPSKLAHASASWLMIDMSGQQIANHEAKMNRLFGDGHVERFDWKELGKKLDPNP